ncbi:hypothetical protein HS7_12570 [Sulfolobales archaeon HS-7]|nr:hypothetical protein HS7_12570 [Sulfolobales archaeon HS-7]
MLLLNGITAVLGTFSASILVYIITNWIQQISKRNNILKLIGYVYRPLYYFINLKYVGVVTYILLLASLFFATLAPVSDHLETTNNIILSTVSYIIFLILFFVVIGFIGKRKKIINNLVEESQYNIPDVDSLRIKWNKVFGGIFVLVIRYFLIILAITFVLTAIFMVIDKDFDQVGLLILFSIIISFIITICVYVFYITRRPNLGILDTDTEIEMKLFDLVKDPAYCVCIIDNSGNEYCGNLESISYGIVIKQNEGTIINLPYELVSKAKSCPKSRNSSSTLQPYQ